MFKSIIVALVVCLLSTSSVLADENTVAICLNSTVESPYSTYYPANISMNPEPLDITDDCRNGAFVFEYGTEVTFTSVNDDPYPNMDVIDYQPFCQTEWQFFGQNNQIQNVAMIDEYTLIIDEYGTLFASLQCPEIKKLQVESLVNNEDYELYHNQWYVKDTQVIFSAEIPLAYQNYDCNLDSWQWKADNVDNNWHLVDNVNISLQTSMNANKVFRVNFTCNERVSATNTPTSIATKTPTIVPTPTATLMPTVTPVQQVIVNNTYDYIPIIYGKR